MYQSYTCHIKWWWYSPPLMGGGGRARFLVDKTTKSKKEGNVRSFICLREQSPKPLYTVLFELVLQFLLFFLSKVFNRWCRIPDSFQNMQKKSTFLVFWVFFFRRFTLFALTVFFYLSYYKYISSILKLSYLCFSLSISYYWRFLSLSETVRYVLSNNICLWCI